MDQHGAESTNIPPVIEGAGEVPPIASEVQAPRNYAGWIILGCLFAYLILGGLASTFLRQKPGEKSFTNQELALRQALTARRLADMAGAEALGKTKETLEDLKKDLSEDARTYPGAAKLYLAIQQELGQKAESKVLQVLNRPEDRAFVRLYEASKLSRPAAESIASYIKGDTFTAQLARVQAKEKGGIEPSGRDELLPRWKAFALIFAGVAFSAVCLLGVGAWILFFALRASGQIKPLGFPPGPITLWRADQFVWKAAIIVGVFFFLSLLGGILAAKGDLPSGVASLVPSLGILAFILITNRARLGESPVTLAEIGLGKTDFAKHLAWGICGFLAELPLAVLLGAIFTKVFSFLPAPDHPASALLRNRPDLIVIVSVLVFGAAIAPFWEEIVFRGLLFPAVSRVANKPLVGGILTSFIFAAIHPQGIILWGALGAVAGVSCTLAYHTKSLVPSITMHTLHNLTLMVGTMLLF